MAVPEDELLMVIEAAVDESAVVVQVIRSAVL
jgi:hypothetical protein